MSPEVSRRFDADQHYYEPLDAFTRHLDKSVNRLKAVVPATIDGRVKLIMGGQILESISNPTFDPVVKPGAMYEYFRGNPNGLEHDEFLKQREPLPDYYRDPDARIAQLDRQGVEKTWMMPTVGMKPEEFLQHDRDVCVQVYKAFNRWLLEDWGFAYKNRIFAPPFLYMGNVPEAVKEVEWALDNGAVLFVVRPTGVLTEHGWLSPGHPHFDPVWRVINEAGATVIPHYCDVGGVGLDRFIRHHSGLVKAAAPPLQIAVGHERPIANYLGSITCDRLFERFPNVRIASVENGAEFLTLLLRGLDRAHHQRAGYFAQDPVQQFKEHVWVAPFWEDNLAEAVSLIGADQVLFGSDWPHPEGLIEPAHYDKLVAELEDASSTDKIMYSNTEGLTALRPAS